MNATIAQMRNTRGRDNRRLRLYKKNQEGQFLFVKTEKHDIYRYEDHAFSNERRVVASDVGVVTQEGHNGGAHTRGRKNDGHESCETSEIV